MVKIFTLAYFYKKHTCVNPLLGSHSFRVNELQQGGVQNNKTKEKGRNKQKTKKKKCGKI